MIRNGKVYESYKKRAEAAEARAEMLQDDLKKRDEVIRGLSNRLTEVVNQLEQAHQERDEARQSLEVLRNKMAMSTEWEPD